MLTCEHCGSEELDYKGFMTTLVGYTSDPPHEHDNNCRTAFWDCRACCSETKRPTIFRCPVEGCDWISKRTCFCHEGEKWDPGPGFVWNWKGD